MGKGKKRPGTCSLQLRPQDLRVKHGSTLDTITNPFVGPHSLLLAPALMTLTFNHLFPLILALGTGWLAHGQPRMPCGKLEGPEQQTVAERGQKAPLNLEKGEPGFIVQNAADVDNRGPELATEEGEQTL